MNENVTKKRQEFQFSPVNFIFEHMPCEFVITQRIVPQDLLCVLFFKFNPEVLLSMTMLSIRICLSQRKFCLREHVPIGGSIFDVGCHVVKLLQLKLKIILWVMFSSALLYWFWLCKTWLFRRFVKYLIEIQCTCSEICTWHFASKFSLACARWIHQC